MSSHPSKPTPRPAGRESHSSEATPPPSLATDKFLTLKQATAWLIEEALRRAHGNQSAAARLLGISQQALSKRLKKRG